MIMKKIKIGQYAKLSVAVLAMAFVAGACDDDPAELAGTVWASTYVPPGGGGDMDPGRGAVVKFTSGTNLTFTDIERYTTTNGVGTYAYNHPNIEVNIPSETVKRGTVSGNTMTFPDDDTYVNWVKVDVVPAADIVGTTWKGVEPHSGATFVVNIISTTAGTIKVYEGSTEAASATVNFTYDPPVVSVNVIKPGDRIGTYISDPVNAAILSGNLFYCFIHPVALTKVTP